MAKASNPQLADAAKKRPLSSHKVEELADVPKIYLNERQQASSSLPSSLQTSLYSIALPTSDNNNANGNSKDKGGLDKGVTCPEFGSNRPIRSSSDIGLPTGSTSCLLARDGTGFGENHLEVFCSPRTFRKSVDSGTNAREHAFRQGDCMQQMDSSNNCLKVLTAASRSGSALSLNSEYTARSIGLLSSDSSSDRDTSLTDSESINVKPSQLRRFMSYPDEDGTPELYARSSHSLGDLNLMEKADKDFDLNLDIAQATPDTPGSMTTKSESVTLSVSESGPSSPGDLPFFNSAGHHERGLRNNEKGILTLPNNMVSYKCESHSHDTKRDNRIRQWLQDMDSHN